jgi:hypothetical protein
MGSNESLVTSSDILEYLFFTALLLSVLLKV